MNDPADWKYERRYAATLAGEEELRKPKRERVRINPPSTIKPLQRIKRKNDTRPDVFERPRSPRDKPQGRSYENVGTSDTKTRVKLAIIDHMLLTPHDLHVLFPDVSIVTLANIRTELKHTLRLLKSIGWEA